MISYTFQDLQNRTSELQQIVNRRPVLIEDNGVKQVLINYDDYKQMAGSDADKPFETAHEFLSRMKSVFSNEELEILANDNTKYDMSE